MRQRLLWCSVFLWKWSQVCWGVWGLQPDIFYPYQSISPYLSVFSVYVRVAQLYQSISTINRAWTNQPTTNQPPSTKRFSAARFLAPLGEAFSHRWLSAALCWWMEFSALALHLQRTGNSSETHRNPAWYRNMAMGKSIEIPLTWKFSMVLSVFNDYRRTPREGWISHYPTGGVGSLPLVVPPRSGALALLAPRQGQGVASRIESRTEKKFMSNESMSLSDNHAYLCYSCTRVIDHLYIYDHWSYMIIVPVVPHKAVAEVSNIWIL